MKLQAKSSFRHLKLKSLKHLLARPGQKKTPKQVTYLRLPTPIPSVMIYKAIIHGRCRAEHGHRGRTFIRNLKRTTS